MVDPRYGGPSLSLWRPFAMADPRYGGPSLWRPFAMADRYRRETTVDDLSDFSNIFSTALYIHVDL